MYNYMMTSNLTYNILVLGASCGSDSSISFALYANHEYAAIAANALFGKTQDEKSPIRFNRLQRDLC
jgi:hypothetical protein